MSKCCTTEKDYTLTRISNTKALLHAQWTVALEEQSHWFILKMNLHFCDMIIYMPLSMVIRLNLKRILKSSSGFVVRTWHGKHPCSCWTVKFKFQTSLQY